MTIKQAVLEKLRELPPEKQQEVLQFVELFSGGDNEAREVAGSGL